jgi:hypothetical protein
MFFFWTGCAADDALMRTQFSDSVCLHFIFILFLIFCDRLRFILFYFCVPLTGCAADEAHLVVRECRVKGLLFQDTCFIDRNETARQVCICIYMCILTHTHTYEAKFKQDEKI